MSFLIKHPSKHLLRKAYSFHTSQYVWDEWTKTSLRRMKKPELVDLARESNLDISGTKNDIIIRLLSHQTNRIVGGLNKQEDTQPITSPQDNKEGSFEDMNQDWVNAFDMKLGSRGSKKQWTNTILPSTPAKAEPYPMNDNLNEKLIKNHNLNIKVQSEPQESIKKDKEFESMDEEWVKAFDMKLGSRGSKKQWTNTILPSTPAKAEPHPMNDSLFKKPSIELASHIEEQPEPQEPMKKDKDFEDVDEEWVKAFDIKLSSRGSRKQSTNTTSPSTATVTEPIISESEIESQLNNSIEKDKLIKNDEQKPDTPQNNDNNNRVVTTVIGSSMLIWFFGGSEVVSNIFNFFSS